jgi:4-carboxymuconolactone decarboxylase
LIPKSASTNLADVPRLAALVDPSEEQQGVLKQSERPGDEASLRGGFAVLAHNPLLLRRLIDLERVFHTPETTTLQPRERELAILRVAAHARSLSEYERHVQLAAACGVTREEADAIRLSIDAGEWNDHDRALIEFVDDALTTNTVSDGSWERAAARLGPAQLIEVLMLVGYYRMITAYLRAAHLDVPARGRA